MENIPFARINIRIIIIETHRLSKSTITSPLVDTICINFNLFFNILSYSFIVIKHFATVEISMIL